MSVKLSFSINKKGSFLCGCCLIVFCWVLFFIQCEYGIGLMWMFLINLLHSDYFDNLIKVVSDLKFLLIKAGKTAGPMDIP